MRRRTTAINIRVTKAEKKKIQLSAVKCGLSLSEYLRRIAVGYAPREIPSDNFYSVRQQLEVLSKRFDGEVREKIKLCLSDLERVYILSEEGRAYGNDKYLGDKGQPDESGQLCGKSGKNGV